jgi:hypothetical protein
MFSTASPYNPAAWEPFFSAEVSASAALTGLIFVAVSINLSRIVPARVLVSRAAKALFTLLGVLLASTLCLVPGQPLRALGCELAATGILVWLGVAWSHRVSTHRNSFITDGQKVYHFILTQLSTLPFIVGGLSLVFARGGGLDWLLIGTVFSFIAALLDAWVLLIEINR